MIDLLWIWTYSSGSHLGATCLTAMAEVSMRAFLYGVLCILNRFDVGLGVLYMATAQYEGLIYIPSSALIVPRS